MARIFVSTSPFGNPAPEPRQMLERSGHQTSYNTLGRKMKPEETAEASAGCEAVIAGTENLTALIESSKALRMISRVGIGLDSVPLKLCRRKGIALAYTPDAVTLAVAELAIGLMIDLLRQVNVNCAELKSGIWRRPVGKRIECSTVGLVGLGRVGSSVARMLSGFRPQQLLAFDIKDKSAAVASLASEHGLRIRIASLDEVISQSDVISFHVPATPLTKNLIGPDSISRMKPSAFIVNTSRGQILDEEALHAALASNRIAGAALDVFKQEPYNGPLKNLPNALLTAHIGSCSEDCRLLMETHAAEDALRFLAGQQLLRPVPEEEYELSEA